MKTRHLDLGCGQNPRNPYSMDLLYGVDLDKDIYDINNIYSSNLTIDPIPFEENYFDSVSAYDFLEHIPRLTYLCDKGIMRFPFVELMNEVWRVLKKDGLFYASTPVWPAPEVFVDPTHVNFITQDTHTYFTLPDLKANIYGFTGCFEAVRVKRARPIYDYEPNCYSFSQKIKKIKDVIKRRRTHIVWEFQAVKD